MPSISSSDRIRLVKMQTLARYHASNPMMPDMANRGQSAEIRILREIGTENDCGKCVSCLPVCDLSGSFAAPMTNDPTDGYFYYLNTQSFFNEFDIPIIIPAPPSGYPTDDSLTGLFVYCPTVCNATNYTINISDISGSVQSDIYNLGDYDTPDSPFERTVFFAIWALRPIDFGSLVVQVVASNACSTTSDDAEFGCFLAGSPVCMADGSFKPIENVAVGDKVCGAFGEINTVNALHRPLLGAGSMVVINGEHSATAHHPHISVDRKFYLAEPDILSGLTYGKKHTVILADGTKEKRVMTGVKKERLLKLTTGIELQTNTGGRIVNTIEYKPMSPMTQVYHLVVGGSHTYIVEGYAVAGWCDERDFNYDTWSPI